MFRTQISDKMKSISQRTIPNTRQLSVKQNIQIAFDYVYKVFVFFGRVLDGTNVYVYSRLFVRWL